MGLSIHYNGRIREAGSLPDLIEEVKDIANIYQWEYHIFETTFPGKLDKQNYQDKIYGICFTPPECETIDFCFLSNGRMSSPVNLKFWGKYDNEVEEDKQDYLYMLSVKTQFAGVKIHQLVIHLFKYLSAKYLADFSLSDEGEYWETGDESRLKERFKAYSYLLNSVSHALQHFPSRADENMEDYVERLIKFIDKKRKNP